MKRENVYKILIALLLIVNLAQLGGNVLATEPPRTAIDGAMPPPPPPSGDGFQSVPKGKLADTKGRTFQREAILLLELSDTQKQQFDALAKAHNTEIARLQKQQGELTLRYFQQPSEALLDKIADMDKQKVQSTESHFEAVYQLLNHEQQANFKAFKQAALRVIIR